jgi:peptide-methionine (R)-S-oxide reductase
MDQRQIVRMIAVGRVALGAFALVAPRLTSSLMFGHRTSRGPVTMATRMLGARDLALGLGMLRALDRDADPASWSAASAVADAGDTVACVLVLGAIPTSRAVPTIAASAGAAVLGARAASHLG